MDKNMDEYYIEINNVKFVCEKVQDGYEECARRIAGCYESRLPHLAAFMM